MMNAPQSLINPEWESALFLLSAPLISERARGFLRPDTQEIDFVGLHQAAVAWSTTERLLVDVAQQLWNGDGAVSLRSLAISLDDMNFDRVIMGLRLRRGQPA